MLAADGTPTLLTLDGTELLPEEGLVIELEDRTRVSAPAAHP